MSHLHKALISSMVIIFCCLSIGAAQGQHIESQLEPVAVVTEVPGYFVNWPISISSDSGLVFIADFKDCCIYVFDEDLSYLHTIGGQGDGPAEFRYIVDIDSKNGVLAVLNLRPSYISLFDYKGNLLDRWNVSASYRWGEIGLTNRNSLYLACRDGLSDTFIKEISLTGELVKHHLSVPVSHPMERASEARIAVNEDQVYISLINAPRIIGFGETEFDWTFDYKGLDPQIKVQAEHQERMIRERSDGFYSYAIHGGPAFYNDHLILGGYHFNLLVYDCSNAEMKYIELGDLAHDLSIYQPSRGRGPASTAVFRDATVVGEEVWFISDWNACLVRFNAEDVLRAAENGAAVKPQPTKK